MRRALGFLVGVLVFVVSTLIGLTLATSAGTIGVSGSYDMPVSQTRAFVQAGTRKLGWQAQSEQNQFDAPVLPWSRTTITVTVEPQGKGSHVQMTGHATRVKELDALLKRQLPLLR